MAAAENILKEKPIVGFGNQERQKSSCKLGKFMLE